MTNCMYCGKSENINEYVPHYPRGGYANAKLALCESDLQKFKQQYPTLIMVLWTEEREKNGAFEKDSQNAKTKKEYKDIISNPCASCGNTDTGSGNVVLDTKTDEIALLCHECSNKRCERLWDEKAHKYSDKYTPKDTTLWNRFVWLSVEPIFCHHCGADITNKIVNLPIITDFSQLQLDFHYCLKCKCMWEHIEQRWYSMDEEDCQITLSREKK